MPANKFIHDFTIVSNISFSDHTFILKLLAPEPLPEMFPGQFVQVLVKNSAATFLRRPFSIHNVDYLNNTISLLIKRIGNGTNSLFNLKAGENLNLIYPLGKGFNLPLNDNVLLVGGGCGVAPLLFLSKYLYKKGIKQTILIGGRNQSDIIETNEYQKFGKLLITTDDGSCGEKGFVINHPVFNETPSKISKIYTCGPEAMMKTIARYAKIQSIDCEVSLENTMACGIGACLCCVVNTTEGNRCVCTEGPVFNINELTEW